MLIISLSLLLMSYSALARSSKNTLVVGVGMQVKALDSANSISATDFRVAANIFDGLLKYKKGSIELEPALATRWEISPDGRRYTFWLRKGVKFHDGTTFDAHAVKFSWDRVLHKDHPYNFTGPFPLRFLIDSVKETIVLDKYKIQFRLDEPHSALAPYLAFPIVTIVSPEAMKKYGKEFKRRPVGTGAFKFAKWKPKQHIIYKRNENYWGEKAKIETLVIRPFTDENVRLTEMFSGGLDIMIELPPDAIPRFESDPNFTLLNKISTSRNYFILNMKEPPFNDKRMRHAVNYAVNRQSIADNILKGSVSLSHGMTPRGMTSIHNEKIKPYPYDPAKARKLIKEAGYENMEIDLYLYKYSNTLPMLTQVATAVQADLAAVGLKVNLNVMELNTYAQYIFTSGLKGKAHMAQWGWFTIEPNMAPDISLSSNKKYNPGGYSNPEVDELVIKAQRALTKKEQVKHYRRIQEIVNEDAPWLFFMNMRQMVATSKRVKNYEVHPSMLSFFNTVTKD